jgi:hypothetical protein
MTYDIEISIGIGKQALKHLDEILHCIAEHDGCSHTWIKIDAGRRLVGFGCSVLGLSSICTYVSLAIERVQISLQYSCHEYMFAKSRRYKM